MWWFAALHANLGLLYGRMGGRAAGRKLLDAGCGTGGLLARLSSAVPDRAAPDGGMVGLDADRFACERARAKSGRPVCAGSVNALPFADGAFDAIVSADVLCHRNVDEGAALAEFHRVLCEQGVLILNLPAYSWLMSGHDKAVATVRRYTRRRVVRLLESAGFGLLFASYWNTILFPVMVATRKLLPDGAGATSDVKLYPAPVEILCRAATKLEHALLRRGVRFPFGGSVIAVAAKQAP
ncbi:MAG TPA: class I SAM-dependent methyltransferase [Stellaceae bacterium]|nr:class I SAM-dependent methyltransferase [Stellaceae bacterium]